MNNHKNLETTAEQSPVETLTCPMCGEEVWDLPRGHKLAKCWNFHNTTGGTLAFDTMMDDNE